MNLLRRLLQVLFGRPHELSGSTRQSETISPPSNIASPTIRTASVPEPAADPYFVAETTKTDLKKPSAQKSLGLDSDAYLPITRQEIKSAAAGGRLFSNAWFGRRDLIPPDSDPRTRLIDRGMVTQGLISPDRLREIHEIGAEMDRLRPTLIKVEAASQKVGDAAVEAARKEKAELKRRKKAEAEERKRLQAEQIASRKANDILFLGRGVSKGLADRVSQLDRLQEQGLPLLSTPADLASALGLTIPKLRWLAFHTDVAARVHYVAFTIPKRSGGTRTLNAPHRMLADTQQWILREILDKLPVDESAHGFIKGRSIVSNALPHAKRLVVVNLDLESFFPSIGFPRVLKVFQRLGYSPAVSTIMALLCTEAPRRAVIYDRQTFQVATGPRGLPQGACTSPAISNQVARRLDRRLKGLAARLDLTYTRYADDLTFSGDEPLRSRVGYLMARVRHIAQSEGFQVNEKKSRVLGQGTAQLVTGLVVNDRPGVPRDEVRRLRAILHAAKAQGLESQNREGHPHFEAWLRGKIAFVSMSRPEVGAKLTAAFNALPRSPES